MSINYGHRPGAGTPIHKSTDESPPDVRTPGEVVGTDGRALKGHQAEDPILALGDQLRKAREKLRAQLALQGHQLHVLADGRFLVVAPKWGLARECGDLEAVEAFARRLGVRP